MSDARGAEEIAARSGVAAGLIAYTMWGVFPVYFKLVEMVPAVEVLAHRIVWAVPFGFLIILARRQIADVYRALTHRRMLGWLSLAAAFISVNWLIYIWAIQNERIFEASLGYYINPLIYVLVGVAFFGDAMRRLRLAAVLLATAGVLILAVSGDHVPYVSLALGASFTIYGVIRKRVVIGAMPGLFVETLVLLPFAAGLLGWFIATGRASFAGGDTGLSALLMLAGPLTVIPLMCFSFAARRLTLTTIGFMQFIAPTLQFIIGIYYGEVLTTAHLVCFGCIWAAVAIFSVDAFYHQQKRRVPL